MPMFNLAEHQMEIVTLNGKRIMFRLEEISAAFPSDDVIYITFDGHDSIPCRLSSAQILIPRIYDENEYDKYRESESWYGIP